MSGLWEGLWERIIMERWNNGRGEETTGREGDWATKRNFKPQTSGTLNFELLTLNSLEGLEAKFSRNADMLLTKNYFRFISFSYF